MIIEAILKINPNAKVVVRGDDLDTCTIEWLDGTSEISKSDIQAKINETAGNTKESNNTVRSTRKNLYGDIGDQLDEIYKDIDAWKARIKKIKDDNPKE